MEKNRGMRTFELRRRALQNMVDLYRCFSLFLSAWDFP